MNVVHLFVFITSCAGYALNTVSVSFNSVSNRMKSGYNQPQGSFHPQNNCLNRSKNKLEFSIFAKNPSFERKQRQQRKSKRLKQVLPLEHMSMTKQMDNLVRKSKLRQQRLFGYRLSELPGDGGVIPLLEKKIDKPAWVRKYFSAYKGRDAEYVRSSMNDDEMVNKICAEPYKTAGKFKTVGPLVDNFFYEVVERVFGPEAFLQATFKKTVASIRKHHEEATPGTQNYYGLQVETLFSHLDPEDMEKLRKVEILVKSGKIDPSLFSSKYDPMLSGNDAGGSTKRADFDVDAE
ncbi:conserved hypothetical protein [Theileria orientalis strain Shintoku]|uniref:Uncharacterized protein n=1 Tax=Theileria orientalis strain Shintoku TaxID=869250 RepID=J4C8B3_THEOR|nr:conserved hypothetical protein [Theileria orientalis strain Shintoku]BAM40488.1 conserved hypothetical protein [Theileria orientalis strain Shintoku]|eukprot:XP_009690789.1 conserved hypothetical protein [Theileria orientalis strain Shintoku]